MTRSPARRALRAAGVLAAAAFVALLGLRNEGKLKPDVQRLIQRDLDLEEARLT